MGRRLQYLFDSSLRLSTVVTVTAFASWAFMLFRPFWGPAVFIGWISFVGLFHREILQWINDGEPAVKVEREDEES